MASAADAGPVRVAVVGAVAIGGILAARRHGLDAPLNRAMLALLGAAG